MAKPEKPSSIQSVDEAYRQRVGNLDAAAEYDREAHEKAEEKYDHPETPLPEEQRFVGNPEDLRKEVDSEEKFSEGLEDGDDTLEEVGGQDASKDAGSVGTKPKATRSSAAKKTAEQRVAQNKK